MPSIKIERIQLAGQPRTLFAALKNDINLNVNGTTDVTLRLTDIGDDNYEIEIVS